MWGKQKKIRLTLYKTYMVYAGLITKVVQREEIFLTNVFLSFSVRKEEKRRLPASPHQISQQ